MYKTVEYRCNPNVFPKPNEILCYNEFMVEESIEIPDHKPNMERIVESKVISAEIDSYKIIDTPKGKKAVIRGLLEQEILYVVDSLCQPVHAFYSTFPFCTFINLWDCGIAKY